MLSKLLTKIFGNRNQRILNRIQNTVDIINSIESEFSVLSDVALQQKTKTFRNSIKNGVMLETLLPEAFATVREASKRILGMRHFDVQLIGGIVLNNNCIAEMKTGEGKTLTSTLPIYLNALQGYGVHVVTMNDYLAKRDADKNAPLFNFLGLSVGLNLSGMSVNDKKLAYCSDVTYGTNNEYGFDYLRDNMLFNNHNRVQRSLYYALVDEVDSILIDEARTPLIISGPVKSNVDLYIKINKIVPTLIKQNQDDSDYFQGVGDFVVDEKSRQVYLTERGFIKVEEFLLAEKIITERLLLYSYNNIILIHYVNAALRAHTLFIKNIDYIVKNNEIIIVDEHTGRIVQGKRWSDGLHQAIEAKENVSIQHENKTLASITFQNYFRLYHKLSGMTGTAITESFEFRDIYNLDTIVIPTNAPMIRNDLSDLLYLTEEDKFNAIIRDIQKCIGRNQPVLVGTTSIEKSELISTKLNRLHIKHNVLNAKHHLREADIIAEAGKPGSITIATNMAGRGTDIVLGGSINFIGLDKQHLYTDNIILKMKNDWLKNHNMVLKSGGLHIIGTERHESRRIDNQLRGRSGRQGDCGSSRFYLSMQDSLMRIFISNKVLNIMKKLGMKSGECIEHNWITKAISRAQKKIENRNFNIRKQLLEYDNVVNEQRRVIYHHRNELIDNKNYVNQIILSFLYDVFYDIINTYLVFHNINKQWNYCNLQKCLEKDFNLNLKVFSSLHKYAKKDKNLLQQMIIDEIKIYFYSKEKLVNQKNMYKFKQLLLISTLDSFWQDHLSVMDYLRQGIHLRSYAQKDPKQEYIRESFVLFLLMINEFKHEVISIFFCFPIKNLSFSDEDLLNHIRMFKSIHEKFHIKV
ncbi:MAG: preprotein translocase subunit SecA [Buchnera aphidicola (Eriosoma harunire)]